IRFATGDLSAFLPGQSACGRTNRRLKGWLGRADMITKVRGMFIHPSQLEKTVKVWGAISGHRLVIENEDGRDSMRLECLVDASERASSDEKKAELETALAENCKIKGSVTFVTTLPDGAKAIEDLRSYDE
ncbi:MAG: phenylacetate--CoA ligase family protein, partial [Alphaproteobacteria bacterium]